MTLGGYHRSVPIDLAVNSARELLLALGGSGCWCWVHWGLPRRVPEGANAANLGQKRLRFGWIFGPAQPGAELANLLPTLATALEFCFAFNVSHKIVPTEITGSQCEPIKAF